MITTSGTAFVLAQGDQRKFLGSSIICEPTYYETPQTHGVRLRIINSVSTSDIDYGYMEVTLAEVDAETGAGSGETAPWFNALQKAIKTKLVAISDNSGTTFTVV